MKFVVTMRGFVVVCVWGGGGAFMSMLGLLHMHIEFAFGWCASGYENVGMILIIGGSMVYVSHWMVLRIFVVVGCL